MIETTVLGGSGTDNANAVAMTPSGDTLAVGRTDSTGFPAGAAHFGTGGATDAFLVRIGAGGALPAAAIPTLDSAVLGLFIAGLGAVGVFLLRR